MPNLPKKLKRDTIVEAVLEVQFEHSAVAEIVVGQLASAAAWSEYQSFRLPLADFPAGVREADASLRYQPIFQLNRPTPGEVIKVGPRVLSLHVLSPYPGWPAFSERLTELISQLYEVIRNPHIMRLGLRYINALSPAHGINTLWDLNFRFEVAGTRPSTELTTAYRFDPRPNVRAQVTLASPTFVVGNTVSGAVAFVDVDVSTPGPFGPTPRETLISWLAEAHDAEKEVYFALWPIEALDALREQ